MTYFMRLLEKLVVFDEFEINPPPDVEHFSSQNFQVHPEHKDYGSLHTACEL